MNPTFLILTNTKAKISKFVKFLFAWQNSFFWQKFLFLLAFAYMILSFWEPSNQHDTSFTLTIGITLTESAFMFLIMMDLIIDFIHRKSDYDRKWDKKFVRNHKFAFKFMIDLALSIDFIYFYSMYPDSRLRMARFCRPCNNLALTLSFPS